MARSKKNKTETASGLYGIKNSNRTANKHWGKNSFNSSFPTSLACYMLANDIPAIYNKLAVIGDELRVVSSEISLLEVFNCGALTFDELDFRFESRFEPYESYSYEPIDGIDLVVKATDGRSLAPLEIKLTVLPTNGTSRRAEDKWGCEVVVRSATTSYCALGMYDSVKSDAKNVRAIFEDACSKVESWTSDFEMRHQTSALTECVNVFERNYIERQKPLVVQTIWKTKGQSPYLADDAFDIVVWSDYAFSRLFLDGSLTAGNQMSRPMRASARLARCLWELSKSGKIHLSDIYRQMAFGTQTDKEFAIGGQKWRDYVSSERILRPALPKEVVDKIISPGYIERLNPERRFDQTLYFTMRKGKR